MTYFFIGLIALGFVGYIGYFITTTQTTKTNADNASGERTVLGTKIDNLSTLLKVEDNLEEGVYRFTFKDKEGKIISEDKTLNDFLKPHVDPLENQIEKLQENLSKKSADSKTKNGEIQSLNEEILSLQNEKLTLETNLKSFLNFITKVQIENSTEIFKEATSLAIDGKIEDALNILSENNLAKDESAIISVAQSQSDLRLLKANLMAISNNISDANTNFEKSIELNQNICNTFQYADYLQFQRNFEKASQYYTIAIATTEDEIELGNLHNNLANTYSQNNDYHNAEKHYKKAIKYRRNTAKGSSHIYKASVAKSLSNYGAFLIEQGRQKESKPMLEEAKTIHQEIITTGVNDHLYSYSLLLMNLGLQYSQENNFEKSIPLLEESLELKKKIIAENNSISPFSELPGLMMNLASTYSYAGKLDLAKAMIDNARINLEKAITKMPSVYLEPYSSALIVSAGIYEKLNLSDDADKFYLKGMELSKTLFDQNPEANFGGYSRALNNYGGFLNKKKKHTEALEVFKTLEKLLDNYDGIETNSMMARKGMLYMNYGVVYGKMNDNKNSKIYYNKVITTLKPILQSGNTEIQDIYNQATLYLNQ